MGRTPNDDRSGSMNPNNDAYSDSLTVQTLATFGGVKLTDTMPRPILPNRLEDKARAAKAISSMTGSRNI